jgi:hypothetical protein
VAVRMARSIGFPFVVSIMWVVGAIYCALNCDSTS